MKIARIKTTVILGIAALAAGLLALAGPPQKADITTENGVRVVRNPKTPVAGPGGAPAVVSLVEDLVIGNDTSREDHWFGFLNSLAVDASGNIYTVDPKNIRIRIFAPDGSLVKAFGRAGQGPGEFSGPGGIHVAPDGTIAVTDVLNSRISYFTPEGAHLKDTLFGTYNIAELKIDDRSNLYIINSVRADKGAWELLKLGPDMGLLKKIHSLSMDVKIRGLNHMPMMLVRLFFDLAGKDRLGWMASTGYEIQVADASGRTVMIILKEHVPQRITEKDRQRYIKSRFPESIPPQLEFEFP